MLLNMLIVTTDGLPGYEIHDVLGEALGVAQRALGRSGGSSTEFQVPGADAGGGLLETRRAAIAQLSQDAQRRGANAVVGLTFDTVDLGGRAIEVCAYGTAVVARPAVRAADPRTGGQATAGVDGGGHVSGGYPSTARQPAPAVVGRDVTISGTRSSGERTRDGGDHPRPRDSSEHLRPSGYPRPRDSGEQARRAGPVVGRDVTISGTRSTGSTGSAGERSRETSDHVQQIRREPPERSGR
jgi:uncharacterized protein YbjQ (UPF0145 family)